MGEECNRCTIREPLSLNGNCSISANELKPVLFGLRTFHETGHSRRVQEAQARRKRNNVHVRNVPLWQEEGGGHPEGKPPGPWCKGFNDDVTMQQAAPVAATAAQQLAAVGAVFARGEGVRGPR